jgi:hypothetical protein
VAAADVISFTASTSRTEILLERVTINAGPFRNGEAPIAPLHALPK